MEDLFWGTSIFRLTSRRPRTKIYGTLTGKPGKPGNPVKYTSKSRFQPLATTWQGHMEICTSMGNMGESTVNGGF